MSRGDFQAYGSVRVVNRSNVPLIDGSHRLVLLEAVGVAGGSGAVFQHRSEQVLGVGHYAITLVLQQRSAEDIQRVAPVGCLRVAGSVISLEEPG